MKLKIILGLLVTHISVGVIGFMTGIYLLPIIIAPDSPAESDVIAVNSQAVYHAEFKRDLKDSDFLHWGEGRVSVGNEYVAFMGELAPGPDYKLYLSPKFVETEVDFNTLKASMLQVGEVKTFTNFVVKMPPNVNLSKFNTVVIWCETFGEFITSAQFR